MPHLKCVACKIRLSSGRSPADPVGDLCPGCGASLEPVGSLTEVVGFRSLASGGGSEFAGRVGDLIERREAVREEARAQADRLMDEFASLRAAAAALPGPEPS